MRWILIICLLALSGCRLYWYKDLLLISVGEATVKKVEYIQEPNSVRFNMWGYDVGEKVVPSATSLILGNE